MIAGPGAGKTTCAWEIAEKLKKQGYIAEYVSEIAKEYVWEERFDLLDGSLVHQKALLDMQKHNQELEAEIKDQVLQKYTQKLQERQEEKKTEINKGVKRFCEFQFGRDSGSFEISR